MKLCDLNPEEFSDRMADRRTKRFERVNRMPHGLRECVYDYGLTVVDALLDAGVKKPKNIRHVVETVLNEFSPTRGTRSSQGIRTELARSDSLERSSNDLAPAKRDANEGSTDTGTP